MTTAGRVFWISMPRVGSSSTNQTSPLRGSLTGILPALSVEGGELRQLGVVAERGGGVIHGGGEDAVALGEGQRHQLDGSVALGLTGRLLGRLDGDTHALAGGELGHAEGDGAVGLDDGVFMQDGCHGEAPLLTRRASTTRYHTAREKAIRGRALVAGAASQCAHDRRDTPFCPEKCELRPYSSFTFLLCSCCWWWLVVWGRLERLDALCWSPRTSHSSPCRRITPAAHPPSRPMLTRRSPTWMAPARTRSPRPTASWPAEGRAAVACAAPSRAGRASAAVACASCWRWPPRWP